jgi:hypothetical protein
MLTKQFVNRVMQRVPCAGPYTAAIRTVTVSILLQFIHPLLPDLLEAVTLFAGGTGAYSPHVRGPPVA